MKNYSFKVLTSIAIVIAFATTSYAAILVQNFMQLDIVVDTPPITKIQGTDADYDGDGDDATGYLQVDLGQTISNDDNTLPTPGSNATLLSHEEITFTCFLGDRTYYTDVLQLVNTTGTEDWDVTLTVESDLAGNPATSDNFSAGDADIYLFTSQIDSTGSAVTERPNPANYNSLAEWIDNSNANLTDGDTQEAIQLEVVSGTLSVAQASTGAFTIGGGEQRQIALVVDCGSNMVDTEDGTFRLTVSATPN